MAEFSQNLPAQRLIGTIVWTAARIRFLFAMMVAGFRHGCKRSFWESCFKACNGSINILRINWLPYRPHRSLPAFGSFLE